MATILDDVRRQLSTAQPLDRATLTELAGFTDILALGALADDARRARHGAVTTFVRVHELDLAAPATWASAPSTAGEVRVVGRPGSLAEAVEAVRQARDASGGRVVRGFLLSDLDALAAPGGAGVYAALAAAGLDEVAGVLAAPNVAPAITAARAAGLAVRVLVVEQAPADRVQWLLDVRGLQDGCGGLHAVAPLPRVVDGSAPTTGFGDVRTVALARLALDAVPSVQVDWRRYGPKLAQVALTVGADDLDAVSAADDQALGSRRAPLEDVRRNISAAGFAPAERDGRHRPLAG